MKGQTWLECYRATAEAKNRGRWRFPLGICVVLYFAITPAILVVLGIVLVSISHPCKQLGLPAPVSAIAATAAQQPVTRDP